MIELKNIKKTYKGQKVIDIDEFCIEEGNIYTITGINGSGKSTFAKILSGLLDDDSEKSIKLKNNQNDVLSVGYLPQNPYVFDMTLEKNILINGNNIARLEFYIDQFGIGYLKGKNCKKFSGGERQKMALIRLMMKDYDLVIFDEPTSAMDEESKKKAISIISEYSKNKTAIVISHDLIYLKKISKGIFKMEAGKLVWENC